VCPTGAITPKSQVAEVLESDRRPRLKVVVQIAPAVRVAVGEMFGLAGRHDDDRQIVAALKAMGFDMVFDTSFTADLTVIEETNEFLGRAKGGKNLPIFTSCCPAG
jgi:NADH-quinone oxidoreductase subunit G